VVTKQRPQTNGHGITPPEPCADGAPAPFMVPDRTLRIQFGDDTEWAGAEVVCTTNLSVDDALVMLPLMDSPAADQIRQAVQIMGDRFIVRWNLHEPGPDGRPVPIPVSGDALSRDIGLANIILDQWGRFVKGRVTPPAEGTP
jgi:hypothetical protein